MSNPRIGIVISSTRADRFGEKAARWVYGIAARRTDLDFEIIDLWTSASFFECALPTRAPVTYGLDLASYLTLQAHACRVPGKTD